VWIFYSLESPLSTPNYVRVDNIFNWTATYRQDSTIPIPYDKWSPFDKDRASNIRPYVHVRDHASITKTKLAAIFMSNCESANNRLRYITEITSYIAVDVYGSCGNKSCSRDNHDKCLEMLQKEYKFYLAFENANCPEYITEKLFTNALR
jgi:glycoprotein 3-alpha-L-fucosyltransferase